MSTSLITLMRTRNSFMRGTAATVLMAFSLMILQPTVAAAQAAGTATVAPDTSAETQLSKTLQRIETQLARAEEKLQNQQDASAERFELKQLRQTLIQLDATVREGFTQVEQHIQDHHLDPVILDRHQAMVDHYQLELQSLTDELDGIETSGDDYSRLTHAKNAKGRLKAQRNKRSQQPFDPNQLPNASLKPQPDHKPKENKADFIQAGLTETPAIQLAALGDFTFDKLAEAGNPAYLAETTEIVLTQAIKDKAAELNHDPVKIYHWVRNHIEWQPTWGAIQNAELTLSAQRGNAMDIASLTIALLRASKIPARYVHGTIDVPAVDFKNWAGGFTDIMAAADYASSGGIPITALISGGQISKIRLEHIWVEAAIDFLPSRGARNLDADSWVFMDPSYKQYDYKKGLDAVAISGIDPEQLAQSFMNSGTTNESEGWVTGFDASILQNAQTEAQQKLEAYIQNNLTDPTVGDVIGGRQTIIQEYPMLPSSLPNKIVVTGSRYDKLPKALQYRLTLELFNSNIDKALDSPFLSHSLPLSQISQKRLGITYVPATPSDEAAMQTYIESGASSLPLYLLALKPVIKLDKQELVTGSAVGMGSDQLLDIIVTSPTQSFRMSYHSQAAGDEMVVGVNGAGLNLDQIKERTLINTEATAAENLYQIALSYWAEADYFTQAIASVLGVQAARLPSVGLFSSPLTVVYNFGLPHKGYYSKRIIDIKRSIHTVGSPSNEDSKKFLLQTGLMHSYLEGSILEQVIRNWQSTGLSSAQVLIDANQQKIPIYHLTNVNSAQLLPQLINLDSAVLADVRAALNAGLEVIIPKQQPSKAVGASGMGYIISDPETGAGSYRISGGLDGGEGEAPCAEPQPEPLVNAVHDIVLTAVLLAILVFIFVESGGVAAPVIPELMAALGLTALTFPATAGEFCTPIAIGYHAGGDDFHNDSCADLSPPNQFPGSDICVSDGTGSRKFDAITGSILWEAKTDSLDNWEPSKRDFFAILSVLGKWKATAENESPIARNCRFGYYFVVGDADLATAARADTSLSALVDQFKVDTPLCLQPWTGKYPKR
ncbi:DUF6310 domain-containing protein [Methylobacter sp. BBA5.1]|uniref:DUF6310 domain-containing protein n=1 Tax=Methylobacter sp. BBA5.1 TaxID=1495064 RepID=UPI001376DBF5|nr:DUF6310 domain-containing protein [Methylobacter sp. BBA5.1]